MIANQPLIQFNTLGLPAKAEKFAQPESLEQLKDILLEAHTKRWPVTILGEGSNVVLADDLPGLVLKPALTGIEVLVDKPDYVLVAAAASENFDKLVAWTLEQGYQGLENLSLIPGSVGAAPYQNIGAYGVELADRLAWVEVMQITNGTLTRYRYDQCRFGYRDSLFKSILPGAYVITRICLRLYKTDAKRPLTLNYGGLAERFAALPDEQQTATRLREIICKLRRSKLPDPSLLPNVGSFFKNPHVSADLAAKLQQQYPDIPCFPDPEGRVKLSAAWLIDQAGFKGNRDGSVGMHDKHALVLVNHGGSRGADVLAYADKIRQVVAEHFHVHLEQEPVTLPVDRH